VHNFDLQSACVELCLAKVATDPESTPARSCVFLTDLFHLLIHTYLNLSHHHVCHVSVYCIFDSTLCVSVILFLLFFVMSFGLATHIG